MSTLVGRHARVLDNAAGYAGGIGRIVEDVDGKVAVLIGSDVVWTEAGKVQLGRFVDGQFVADEVPETRDVPDQGPARDVVVEGIERATGLNGLTLLEQLHDQGLTIVPARWAAGRVPGGRLEEWRSEQEASAVAYFPGPPVTPSQVQAVLGDPLPLHRAEAATGAVCATCDGGGCLDCTDPA